MINLVMKNAKFFLLALLPILICSCTGSGGGYYQSYTRSSSYHSYSQPRSYATPSQQVQGEAYVVEPSSYVTSYGQSPNSVYVPPNEPMIIAPSNVRASYSSRMYDSYGYLQNGVYYQTSAKRGIPLHDYIQTQNQWPRGR